MSRITIKIDFAPATEFQKDWVKNIAVPVAEMIKDKFALWHSRNKVSVTTEFIVKESTQQWVTKKTKWNKKKKKNSKQLPLIP